MKRTAANEILPLGAKLDPRQLDQALQRHILLQPLNLVIWNTRHALNRSFAETLSSSNSAVREIAYTR
jgi:hypothetical protein